MYSLDFGLFFPLNFLSFAEAIKNISKENNKTSKIIPNDKAIKPPTITRYHPEKKAKIAQPLSLEYK